MTKNSTILNLPNCINVEKYKPIDKNKCRELWGLNPGNKYIMFGAVNSKDDPRKGYSYLVNALNQLKSTETELIVFGSNDNTLSEELGIRVHNVGSLKDEISLVSLYNCADVMVVPSLQENLSNVIMESMSCGTSVVAFNIGGNSDLIRDKQNGVLCSEVSSDSLAEGIDAALLKSKYLGQNARKKIISDYSYNVVSTSYLDLYKKVFETPVALS